jgi:ERCC4-type nuclease
MQYCSFYNIAKKPPFTAYQYAILADARERKVIPHFPAQTINVRQIECGDFQIWCRNSQADDAAEVPVAVIERKTWKDLAASIIDGRADSQHNRMIDFSRKNSSLVYYMIEGPVFQPRDKHFPRSNLTFSSLVKRLDHWSSAGNVIVKHSRDHADTAQRIIDLVKNFSDDYEALVKFPTLVGLVPESVLGISLAPLGTKVHCDVKLPALWTALPGISAKTAAILAKKFKLSQLLAMAPTDANIGIVIEHLRSEGARCGKKTAYKILTPDPVRLLSSIKGVSRNRAMLISQSLPDFVETVAGGNTEILGQIGTLSGMKPDRTVGEKIRSAFFQ